MKDYVLKIRKDNFFYVSCFLKADTREEAVIQSNEIMNRFPEKEYTAEVIEKDKDRFQGEVFSWFN